MLDSITTTLKDNQRNIGIGLVVMVICGIIGYVMYNNARPKLLTQINGGASAAPEGESSSDAELIFFFANWCPHCKEAKPQWEEVKKEYSGKTVNGYEMVFTEVDCTEESDEVKQATKQYEIEGYPTIKLVKDGQVIDYDAKPDKETMVKFINTVV